MEARITPPPCRTPVGPSSGTSQPCPRSAPGFDVARKCFDTSSVVRSRSSPRSSPDRYRRPLPPTLTTTAFDRCRLGWFEACSRKPTSKGLPSSSIQLRKPFGLAFVTHDPLIYYFAMLDKHFGMRQVRIWLTFTLVKPPDLTGGVCASPCNLIVRDRLTY